MSEHIVLRVNGTPHAIDIEDADMPLLCALRGELGNELVASGQAKPKRPDQYKVVGQSIPRRDVAKKVFARLDYVTDVTVAGMLHGRMIRAYVCAARPSRRAASRHRSLEKNRGAAVNSAVTTVR